MRVALGRSQTNLLEGCRIEEDEDARLDWIDVLRGFSIVTVVVHHICLRSPFEKSVLGQHLPRQLIHDIDWNGGNGVTVFFAVSGFLITTTSLRRWGGLAAVRMGEFYRLRFARIAPLLLLLLAVLSVLATTGVRGYQIQPPHTLGRAVVAALTFHLNWLEARRGYLPANWDVLWSLSVEEMFYLFFPLLCWALRGGRWLVGLLGVFVVVGPFARLAYAHSGIWSDTSYLGGMDAIALGCLAAMLAPRLRLGRGGLLAMQAAGVAMMTLVLGFSRWTGKLGLYKTELAATVLPLGACLVMMAVVRTRREGSWASAPLRWFGRNSYEVYLTHMFVVLTGTRLFVAHGRNWWWAPVWLAGMVGLAGVLGAMVARGYSEPMNRWLRRGMPHRIT